MTHAHGLLGFVAAGLATSLALALALAPIAACSAAGAFDSALSSEGDAGAGRAPGKQNDSPSAASSGGIGGASPAFSGPVATGVILVHAAAFPSFRLCFENLPNQVPQPDSKVMPEANVVGVELGSVVRLNPIEQPVGKIYVINEAELRESDGQPDAPTCSELVAPPGTTTRTLIQDIHYHVIQSPITTPLGQGHAQVLAITGCGSQAFLNLLDGSSSASTAACGAGYDQTHGNLKATVIDLQTSSAGATDSSIPIQLFHMSSAIEAFRGASGTLSVGFGPLAGLTPLAPITAGSLYTPGPTTSLTVDQNQLAVYGADGFRIRVSGSGGDFSADQTLAAIQELSSPTELPSSYYRTASNYALLLLGDPAHSPQPLPDGGSAIPANFNPRRAVHLLAIPVVDPTQLDAGTEAGTTAPTPVASDAGR